MKSIDDDPEGDYIGMGRKFYIEDLQLVKKGLKHFSENNKMERDLVNYIVSPLNVEEMKNNRFDTLKHDRDEYLQVVNNILSVKNAPLGKWPTTFSPAFMQQFAINLAIGKADNNLCITSVNGAPGTGKTTLLKEIVVNNIIERAILLSDYKDADDAFKRNAFKDPNVTVNIYSEHHRYWYSFKNDKINDYSILVTSSNNTAVENISKELPKKIDNLNANVIKYFDISKSEVEELYPKNNYRKEERKKDIYFTKYAESLISKTNDENQENDDNNYVSLTSKEKAWGLIAAPIGKKSNIRDLYNKAISPLKFDFLSFKLINARKEKYTESRSCFIKQLNKVRSMQTKLAVTSDFLSDICDLKLQEKELNEKLNDMNSTAELGTASLGSEEINNKVSKINNEISLLNVEKTKLAKDISDNRSEKEKYLANTNIFTKLINHNKYNNALERIDEINSTIDRLSAERERKQRNINELEEQKIKLEEILNTINNISISKQSWC